MAITILISLGLAQLLSKEFFGRRFVRWAIIVPWAASLVITSRLFTLLYDFYHGLINRVLVAITCCRSRSTSSVTITGRCRR